jgi:hypothetical protein
MIRRSGGLVRNAMDKQRLIEQRILAQHEIVAQRLRANPDNVLARARANLTRWKARYEDEAQPTYLHEWEVLLAGPLKRVEEVLTADSQDARRLRSSSPFAGVVSARERWSLYRRLGHDTE